MQFHKITNNHEERQFFLSLLFSSLLFFRKDRTHNHRYILTYHFLRRGRERESIPISPQPSQSTLLSRLIFPDFSCFFPIRTKKRTLKRFHTSLSSIRRATPLISNHTSLRNRLGIPFRHNFFTCLAFEDMCKERRAICHLFIRSSPTKPTEGDCFSLVKNSVSHRVNATLDFSEYSYPIQSRESRKKRNKNRKKKRKKRGKKGEKRERERERYSNHLCFFFDCVFTIGR